MIQTWKVTRGEVFVNVNARDGLVTTTLKDGAWVTLDPRNALTMAWLIIKYSIVALFQKRIMTDAGEE